MPGSAIVLGAGPGLGAALGRRFARAGYATVMASRDQARIEELAAGVTDGRAVGWSVDATDEAAVAGLVERAERELGPVEVAVYNPSGRARGAALGEDGIFVRGILNSVLDLTGEALEATWRATCLGGFFLGREVARRMVPRGRGTILYTGATGSMRGGARFALMAVGKFGARALAQSMAREFGPQGIHVAHIIVDGQIMAPRYTDLAAGREPDALLDPDALAETFYRIHAPHRSAWTFEADVRPWVEKF